MSIACFSRNYAVNGGSWPASEQGARLPDVRSGLNLYGNFLCTINLNAEVAHCAFEFVHPSSSDHTIAVLIGCRGGRRICPALRARVVA